jgi:Tol biopolymer transport system component
VTSHCGREDKGCAYSEAPQISPDAKKVAYTWYDDDETAREGQLRVIANSAGAKPKVLLGGGDISMIRAHGWSPDGKNVLVLIHLKDRTQWQIGTVSTEDGKLAVLKTVRLAQDGVVGDPSFSPDGRYIAYSAPLLGRPAVRRIYVLKADGSGEIELTRDDAVSNSPVWTPDGGSILFTNNQLGHTDLWGIPVRDGKAAGAQKVVKRDMDGAYLHSVTKNGSVIYSSRRFEYAITLAEIERGARLPRVQERINGHAPRWSPDGKLLAYGRPRSAPGTPTDLVVRSLDGEERKYPHTGTGSSTIVAWFRDGQSVLQRVGNADGTSAFYRIDLAGGNFTKVLTQDPGDQQKPWFLSADEKALYFAEGGKNLERLVAIDFASGQKQTIATFSSLLNYAVTVSPDRTKLGVLTEPGAPKERSFGVIDLPEGTYRELYRAPIGDLMARRQVMWTADSKALLFPKADQTTKNDGTLAVMQLPIAGGPAVPLGWRIEDGLPVEIFPRPGSSTSVALAKQEGIGEFWALDNVLGALAKVTR